MVEEANYVGSSTLLMSSTVEKSNDNSFDEQSKSELLTHVQLLLTSVGLNDSAKQLGDEIERRGLVPKRFNFYGEPCSQTFDEYVRANKLFSSNLIELIKRLNCLTSDIIPPVIPSLPIRLFSSKRQSIGRRKDVLVQPPRLQQIICRRPVISASEKFHPTRLLLAREFGGQCPMSSRLMLRKETLKNIDLHCRILGHLGPIYCVKFDAMGRYIFTGADDNLIKMWDARTCLLRYTFRGHTSYIMDLTISPENTMLASGSMDKTVRVWCLQRGKTLMVYKGHTATISTISYLPFFKNDTRYLVSAGNDCTVVFYKYCASTKEFCGAPTKFNERTKPGSRIMTMCYSPGGSLVVMGDTHQNIRIFEISETCVKRLFQIAAHTDRVDSLVWAHNSLRFVSGSKDGTAKAWFITNKGWNCSTLKVSISSNSTDLSDRTLTGNSQNNVNGTINNSQSKKNAYKVTMLCWSLADDLVVSSGSDNLLRIWNWQKGELLRILSGHTDESFVLLAHPIHKEIVVSVGHDAMLMIWNIYEGTCLTKHRNESDNHEIKAIYDMAISPDGTLVSFVDNHGHLSILGLDSNQKAKSQPHEQFFSTDYRPLSMDDNGYVLDELSGLAPQNMDPPLFVNSEGIPHSEEFQRLVPGNDLIEKRIEPMCPWVTRKIVPELEESARKILIEQWEIISHNELDEFNRCLNALDNLIAGIDAEHRHLVPKPKKPRTERSNNGAERRAHIEQMANLLMNPPPGEPRYVICDEDDTDDDSSYTAGDDSHLSDGANTLRSSNAENLEDEFPDEFDSDYEEGAPERPTVYRTRTSVTVTGRIKKRRIIVNSGESSNTTLSGNEGTNDSSFEARSSRQKNRKRNSRKGRARVVSSDEADTIDQDKNGGVDDDDGIEISSTSAAKTNRRGRKPRANPPSVPSSSNQNSSHSSNSTPFTEGDENSSDFSVQSGSSSQSKRSSNNSFENRIMDATSYNVYPQWMLITERRRFPYIAQLGDVVVYFAQGHRAYINTVIKHQLFKIPRKMFPKSDLDVMEVCVVDSIKYVSVPFRLTVIRLNQLRNNSRTDLVFDLMYHDYEGVADFVILKEHYDLSLSYNYKAGDAVELLLYDQFYTGIVQQRRPLEEDYPNSEWCSVVVRWDNNDGDDEPVCPWDLQPKQRNRKSDTMATKEEMEKFGDYSPRCEDWPIPLSHNHNGILSNFEACSMYLDRARMAILQILEHEKSLPFRHAVDLREYPEYCDSIEYPVDLQIIDERIRNRFYRRHLSLLRDVQYLALNARKFNDLKSDIVHVAEIIVETIFRFLSDFSISNAANLIDELMGQNFENPAFQTPLKVTIFRSNELLVDTEFKTPNSKRLSFEGSKNKSPQTNSVKWVSECRDMANEIINSSKCLKSEEMQSFCSSHTEENAPPSLDGIMNHIEDFEGPQQFVDALSKFFRDFKSFLQDNHSEGRKSRTFSEILNVDSNLLKLSKPVIAKFKRMNSDAECSKTPLASPSTSSTTLIADNHHCELRKKRAAALSAQSIWRTGLVDSMAALPTTTMNLRNHQRKDNMLNADLHHSYARDYFDGDESNLPGTSGLNGDFYGRKKAKIECDVEDVRQRSNIPLNETTNTKCINNNNESEHFSKTIATKISKVSSSNQNTSSTSAISYKKQIGEHLQNKNNLSKAYSSEGSSASSDEQSPSSSRTTKNQRENKANVNDRRSKVDKGDSSGRPFKSDSSVKDECLQGDDENSSDKPQLSNRSNRKVKRRVGFSPSQDDEKHSRKYSSHSLSSTYSTSASSSGKKRNSRLKKRQLNGKRKANGLAAAESQKSKRPRRAAAYVGRGAYEETSANDEDFDLVYNGTNRNSTSSRTGRAIRVNAKYSDCYDS